MRKIGLACILIGVLFSCKKEPLKTGDYDFLANSLSYQYDGSIYKLESFSLSLDLVYSSTSFLEFRSGETRNFLTVETDNTVFGKWSIPGTGFVSDNTGFVLSGWLDRKGFRNVIKGALAFKIHPEGTYANFYVDAMGDFVID